MRKNIVIISIFLCLFTVLIIISVNQKSDRTVLISENTIMEKNINELASIVYDDGELKKILSIKGSMSELNSNYTIECLRKTNKGFRVSYLGKNKVLILLFDEKGNYLFGKIYKLNKLKCDFEKIHKGMYYKNVESFDNVADYTCFNSGRTDLPMESVHYTEDGYIITVHYDSSLLNVTGLTIDMI